jgi:hypothetical protein
MNGDPNSPTWVLVASTPGDACRVVLSGPRCDGVGATGEDDGAGCAMAVRPPLPRRQAGPVNRPVAGAGLTGFER